jgi:serine protease Do
LSPAAVFSRLRLKELIGLWPLVVAGVALGQTANVPKQVQTSLPAVVHLLQRGESSGQPSVRKPLGAGVIIDSDGRLITLAHLIVEKPILVRLADGRELEPEVIFADAKSDVALLRIRASGISIASIGDPAALPVGATVFAAGAHPDGATVVMEGSVSQKQLRPYPEASFIQTSARISGAMAGGPLFDGEGRLVGLNVLLVSRSSGATISFVIPITYVLAATEGVRTK